MQSVHHGDLENSINGYWKNKIILVSDDEIKAGSSISDEIRHTKYSDDIYNLISDIAFIKTLYGPMYEATYNGSSRRLPELTNDIISNLNDGAALINYIGHGDTEKWGAEYIIEKDRDVSLINILFDDAKFKLISVENIGISKKELFEISIKKFFQKAKSFWKN